MIGARTARLVLRSLCALVAAAGLLGLSAASSYVRYDSCTPSIVPVLRSHDESFTFVAYGDIEDDVVGFRDVFERVSERAKPDFGVVLGDIAKRSERARESYVVYSGLLDELSPEYPLYTVPGNHDRPDLGEPDEYVRAFGPLNWWFVHSACVFVGIDNSSGVLSPDAERVLREAGAAAGPERRVVLFAHVPLWSPEIDAMRPLARRERWALDSIDSVRASLGRDIAIVFTAHTDTWSRGTDAHGTLHVCCGADPGLGWPAGSTPQVAALCTVGLDGFDVVRVRVPFRRELSTSVRQVGHLYVYSALRSLCDPFPVWSTTMLALVGWWLSRRRRRKGVPDRYVARIDRA